MQYAIVSLRYSHPSYTEKDVPIVKLLGHTSTVHGERKITDYRIAILHTCMANWSCIKFVEMAILADQVI
jgi:hypothetical protein